ncbi:hypothetical protein [Pseudescherichia sp.]|uniref:hypothetical protein n=1 Tax=Pseudescherichia sp. TaxID=2055881 RepID=UPI00289FF772|nr:hypothetical protein [Pseudescherichia sp.]
MNIWPIVFLFVSLATCASSNFGVWSTSCSDGEGFTINIESKSNPLIVNDNQIVINIHAKEIQKNKIDIFYDGTADLGRGGMNFDWNNVSSTMPLAELNIINQNGELQWKGFYDMKKSKYYWTNDPDFVQSYAENGIIKLHKCKSY